MYADMERRMQDKLDSSLRKQYKEVKSQLKRLKSRMDERDRSTERLERLMEEVSDCAQYLDFGVTEPRQEPICHEPREMAPRTISWRRNQG
jgi:hypothetical protein